MNKGRILQYASLTLIFAGIAILGAAVGTRFAIGIIADAGCSGTIGATIQPCQVAIKQLNEHTKTLLTGGVVPLISGIVGLNYITRVGESNEPTPETNP